MTAVPRHDDETPCLKAALAYLEQGMWPVVIASVEMSAVMPWITSPGKSAFEKEWGLKRPTAESLRDTYAKYPSAGVGLKLGATTNMIDIEVDDVRIGYDTLRRIFGGTIPLTLSYESNRGTHYFFQFDARLARWGKSQHKIEGVEFRFGNLDAESRNQLQSVAPPTVKDDGKPRQFSGHRTIERLPECFFDNFNELFEEWEESRNPKSTPSEPSIIPMNVSVSEKQDQKKFDAYIISAMTKICEDLEGVTEGGRNNALHEAALKMGSLIGANATDRRTCEAMLQVSADSLKLGKLESKKTIRSGIDAGILKPRDLSGIGFVSRKQIQAQEIERRQADESEPYEWAPPRETISLPVLPFPVQVFPEPLQRFVTSVANKLKCPVDYPACAALGLIGAVSGLSVTLRVENTWIEGPNLYITSIGGPGTGKSPAYKIMEQPIFKIDARMGYAFADEMEEWEALPTANRPRQPQRRHLTLDDTTREAIADIHSRNPRGVIIIKDELASWINSMNAYRGSGDDIEFYLAANTGALIKVTRKSSPFPLIVERPCITVMGPLTPAKLPAIAMEGVDNGWFDRILFSYPERIRKVGWVREQVPDELIKHWKSAIDSLWAVDMNIVDGRHEPNEVEFTDEAFEYFIAWTEQNENEMIKDDFQSDLEGPWSKMKGYCARFALILSRARNAYNSIPGQPAEITNVGIDDVWGATFLAEYFKSHHRKARAELSKKSNDKNETAMMILKFMLNQKEPIVKSSEISRNYKYLGDDGRDDAITWLITRGYIREIGAVQTVGRRGRPPKASYEINPFVRDPELRGDFIPESEPGEGEVNE